MEIGIDSFAALQNPKDNSAAARVTAISELLERIAHADQVGLDIFGIGEHHRAEFLDAAPPVILAAAAARTKHIRLASAVAVLSAADPVRVFQNFSTLDLISNGRAEMVVGRGSFTEAFPLFGYNLADYDALFSEKLHLLMQISSQETITWQGQFRAPLTNQAIHPRPAQTQLPI
ncbi:MAG: LLM class flavin-dependent oxidoreductase, partial [Paracoccaceae bacterium]|nr:LLM class flavin-dependent oxidoreductase [Paracoccaceae bacterium]